MAVGDEARNRSLSDRPSVPKTRTIRPGTADSALRRSVPSNIAEGKGRRTSRDFAHFSFQARGSLLELETQLLLAQQLNYISEQETALLLKDSAAVGRALTGLINALEPRPRRTDSREPIAESDFHV